MIRAAQLLLVLTAAAVWLASRLPWVSVTSFDGLGQPVTITADGARWSTALLPLAVLLPAAALAALAVRGWLLRAVSVLLAMATLMLGYLGVSLIVMPDVGPRGAAVTGVPVMHLIGSQRHVAGAWITVGAALCALLAAALLMRSAATAAPGRTRYAVGRGEPSGTQSAEHGSERGMWDALDAGLDPTDTEGR